MWILTEEYNQYDQYGAYFIAAWLEKPTWDQLKKELSRVTSNCWLDDLTKHVMNGGGRKSTEDQWYNLFEYEETK